MAEYTIKDVIIDPEDPRLEGAIGKEVYHSNYPVLCLDYANNGSETASGKLDNIYRGNEMPFISNEDSWVCIIIKKEESYKKYAEKWVEENNLKEGNYVKASESRSRYEPFSYAEEFINEYSHNHIFRMECDTTTKLDNYGMWLRCKGGYVEVEYISNQGINEGTELVADWQDLFDNYTFLDGKPCGKLVED